MFDQFHAFLAYLEGLNSCESFEYFVEYLVSNFRKILSRQHWPSLFKGGGLWDTFWEMRGYSCGQHKTNWWVACGPRDASLNPYSTNPDRTSIHIKASRIKHICN